MLSDIQVNGRPVKRLVASQCAARFFVNWARNIGGRNCSPGSGLATLARRAGATRVLGVALSVVSCTSAGLPDPRSAAMEFRSAVERGDAKAVHGMLVEKDRRRMGLSGVGYELKISRDEIRRRAERLVNGSPSARVEAEFWTPRGDSVSLVNEHGVFRVSSAGALPALPNSPTGALTGLRQALRQRDYAAFLRLLTDRRASLIDATLRAIGDGLGKAKQLDVRVEGDEAEVIVPGGHWVKLKREDGVWKVEDLQ